MTLHWWMHWFWITLALPVVALLLVAGRCSPVHSQSTPEPWALSSSVEPPLEADPTASQDTNSSSRNSKSLPTHPVETVTDRVKVNKLDVEPTEILSSTIDSLNVSDSESVNDDDIKTSTMDPLEKLGRAASRSLDDDDEDEDTTDVPSVAPVSKSRIAGPLSDGHRAGLDAAAITGISLGIVVFAGIAGAVSFVVYRRRYLNKPQTLNDKCSNPDSSGYIDDSTLRENSEEMYSLDNDSFLNSLEAMTIQNYWTDNQETCWRHSRPC